MSPVPMESGTAEAAPIDTLSALHRAGALTERYPEVQRLLARIPGDDPAASQLRRAGQLLSTLDSDEVLREHPDIPTLTIAVTGHGTIAQLIPALTVQLARHGILLHPVLGDFDSYVFDLSDQHSTLLADDPDIIVCALDSTIISDELPTPWTTADLQSVIDEKLRLLESLIAQVRSSKRATLVLNTIPLFHNLTAQLVERQSRAELAALWNEMNARLLRLGVADPGVIVFDLNPAIAEIVNPIDLRLSLYAKVHLPAELLAHYARDIGHIARHIKGGPKKCLVVDLDETIWGGVLGDDGAEGIEVADTPRGEAFADFQQTVKQLGSQGVLIAAASKNDVENVRDVLREHPRMVLREDDFVRIAANWRPKQENLRELAEDLNIGLDSLVFADDNAFERGLVQHGLPEVTLIELDDEPALHTSKLLREGWFDLPELTSQDIQRPAKYREELTRRDFLHTFTSIEDYLAELNVVVDLAPVSPADVARVAQLTARTNQFNLTTQRLQSIDVEALTQNKGSTVLAIHSRDRFGDNGLVGAVFLHWNTNTLHIDNFVLSCRVFSRGIEQACLSAVLEHAKNTGASAITAEYRKTAKNDKVRAFYPDNGFSVVADDGQRAEFRHDLIDISEAPVHLRLVDQLAAHHTAFDGSELDHRERDSS